MINLIAILPSSFGPSPSSVFPGSVRYSIMKFYILVMVTPIFKEITYETIFISCVGNFNFSCLLFILSVHCCIDNGALKCHCLLLSLCMEDL